MDELKNKSNEYINDEIEDNYLSELDDNLIELNELEDITFLKKTKIDNINLKIYNIYFYLNIKKDNTFVYPIQSDFFNVNNQHVYELIKNAVKKINNEKIIITDNDTSYIVSLKDIEDDQNIDFYIKNYELRPCKKKNFMPKNDCPSYSSSSLLKNIENENISFIPKQKLSIMLLEKLETDEKENNDKYQIKEEDELFGYIY